MNKQLVNWLKQYQTRLMAKKDQRMSVINEAMTGVRVIKFFAWEESFLNKIGMSRKAEIGILRVYIFIMAVFMVIVKSSPTVVGMVTFIVHTKAFRNKLTASVGFTSLLLFQQLRMPILMIPDVFNYYIQAKVASKRIKDFLLQKAEKVEGRKNPNLRLQEGMQVGEVFIDGGEYQWRGSGPTERALRGITLHVRPGTFVCVYGPTGSGKTSLLLALLKELVTVRGRSEMKGSVAYACQQAWIQNATVRDNILFGKAFNEARYNEVVKACALVQDFKILEAGDMTEIGEKGINLSGGQQQRVSLARAVYADADIYLMDDVLSAVDAHVGKHIFTECFQKLLAVKPGS